MKQALITPFAAGILASATEPATTTNPVVTAATEESRRTFWRNRINSLFIPASSEIANFDAQN
ncbi:MAG TPA: hypothetical protein VHK65_13930 [Candidatus Dormibacteraeota bacterium]|nr:hypothetical protein [Candidatus Dormibacteraeota bacterium]